MPYIAKGKCVYKKNKDGSAGEKVGCTEGPVDEYIAALYANTDESKQTPMNINLDTLIEMVEEEVLAVESEAGYTQNVYKVSLRLRINKNRGGDMTDILNEIRGIEGVTTVSHEAAYSKQTDLFNFGLFILKYQLVGRDADPIRYTKVKLAPGIRRIKGVDIQQIQSSPQKIS